MKGGLVVALAALTALKEAKALDGMHITIVMTGDEEDSGRPLSLARASLVEAAKAADVAIGLENGADDPKTALTARRGYTGWQIDVQGAQRAFLADLQPSKSARARSTSSRASCTRSTKRCTAKSC